MLSVFEEKTEKKEKKGKKNAKSKNQKEGVMNSAFLMVVTCGYKSHLTVLDNENKSNSIK